MMRRLFQALAVIVSGLVLVQAEPLPPSAWTSLPPHPRLFANAARWDSVKREIETDAVSRDLFAVVKATAERLLDQPPVEYVDKGAFWHGPMRQAQGRIMALAMMYRISGEARFLDRAKLEMNTMAALATWYPQHFLDTAEGALGMAVGLDWLRDALAPMEIARYEDALINKALRVSLADEDGKSWISGNNNWTAVCHGGLVIAALTVAERDPELAQQIVARAVKNMPRYVALYAPAGAYSEGPDYWAYGTTFYALMAEALRSNLCNNDHLLDAPGFLQTADYTLMMTAPSGRLYNFADNGSSLDLEPIMFWFARELKRGDLIQREITNLRSLASAISKGTPSDDGSRMLPLALIWHDSKLPSKTTQNPPLTWWSKGGSQPQAVMRSAWNDPRATFVGIKAGTANDSHAHMDIGSFIFEANRVRWAVDLGRESYPHARSNGIANTELFNTQQNSQRWRIFRCGPEGHNLIRFNKKPQMVDGKAEIRETTGGFLVDLTPVVRDQVTQAERKFILKPDHSTIIRDSWQTGTEAANVSWQWLTEAKATIEADGFNLQQSGETLRLRAISDGPLSFDAEDVSAPKNKFDSPNPGLVRLTIQLTTPPQSKGHLEVSILPGR